MVSENIERGLFLVNCLGIVYDKKSKKILIGLRKDDPFVKELSWTFPGGRPEHDKKLEESLKHEIKKKTGINVKVNDLIYARIPKERDEFLLLYYRCEPVGGKLKAGEKFTDAKWVKPSEVVKHFSTSIDPKISKFLKKL